MSILYLRSGATSPTPANTTVSNTPTGAGTFTTYTPTTLGLTASGSSSGIITLSNNQTRPFLFCTDAGVPNLAQQPAGDWGLTLKVLAVTTLAGSGNPINQMRCHMLRMDENNVTLQASGASNLINVDLNTMTLPTTLQFTIPTTNFTPGSANDRLGLQIINTESGGTTTQMSVTIQLDNGDSYLEKLSLLEVDPMMVVEHTSFDFIGAYDINGFLLGPRPSFDAAVNHHWVSSGYTQVAGLYDGSGVALATPSTVQFDMSTGGYDSKAFVLHQRIKLSNVTSQTNLGSATGPSSGAASIETDSSGHLIVKNAGVSFTLTGSTVLSTNTVYEAEIGYANHPWAGKAWIKINGVLDASTSGVNTGSGFFRTWTWSNPNLTFDDVAIKISNDHVSDSGTFDETDFLTYLGVPRFGTLWVDGDGNYVSTWIDGDGGGGALYTHIDETAADGITTYIHTPGSGGLTGTALKHSATLQNSPSDVGVIPYVISSVACSHSIGSGGSFVYFLRHSSTDYENTESGDFSGSTGGDPKIFERRAWDQHPTGTPWTKTLLDAGELGWYPNDAVANHDGSQVSQAILEYLWYVAAPTTPPGEAALYSMPMTGVGW